MANIPFNGGQLVDALPSVFNNAAEDGATFAVKLDLSSYAGEAWEYKLINDSSTAIQKVSWKSLQGSNLSASIVVNPDFQITEFSFSSSDKVGSSSKVTSSFKSTETYTEKDTVNSSTHNSNYSGTLNYKNLGISTAASDDIVYSAIKSVKQTDVFTYASNGDVSANLKETGTYTYSAVESGYNLSITKGALTFNEVYQYSGSDFNGTFDGSESHKYSLSNSNNDGGKITFTGNFIYSGTYLNDPDTPVFDSLKYTFSDLVVENALLKATTKTLVNTSSSLDIGISAFADFGPDYQSNPNVDEIYNGLSSLLATEQLTQANVVTLKVAQTFSAGAGNDSVTGSAGDDVIDGGEGNDTVNAGAGNDVLAWSGFGVDTYDGGANTIIGDRLDLSEFGNGLGTLYDLTDRGNDTYVVTGSSKSFTITNKVPGGGTLTAKGVEFVTIGDETVSVEKFLSPNVTFITGLDVLSSEPDYSSIPTSIPSVYGFKNSSNYTAGQLVDMSELLSQDWNQEVLFNPDAASNSFSFINADKSSITAKTLKTVDTLTANVTVKSGDAAQSFIGDLKTATKSTLSGNGLTQTITKTTTDTISFSFKDTRGTTEVLDDLVSTLNTSAKYVLVENGTSTKTTVENTVKQSYSVDAYKLSIDHIINHEQDVLVGSLSTSIYTNEIKSYFYSDSTGTGGTNYGFTLSLTGKIAEVFDGLTTTTNTVFNNVNWVSNSFAMKTIHISSNMLSTINLGNELTNDITTVQQDLTSQLLPELLKGDNTVTLKSWEFNPTVPGMPNVLGSGFRAGEGADKVTGSKFDDLIYGDSGNDVLRGGLGNDVLNGGSGLDKLSGGFGSDTFVFNFGDTDWNSDLNGLTVPKVDQILDYQKNIDYIALDLGGAFRLSNPQVNMANDTDHASISGSGVAGFAAGSGKTMKDAVNDVANSLDEMGDFAFFKVNNAGNYYMFISDGVQGVTESDVVVQLVGINYINGFNNDITNGVQVF